jgi:hypothetical protein
MISALSFNMEYAIKIISAAETFRTKAGYEALDSITAIRALASSLLVEACKSSITVYKTPFSGLFIIPVPQVSN